MKEEEAKKIIELIKENADKNLDTEKKLNLFLNSTGFYDKDGHLKVEIKNV